jgi:hypothetical protein
MPLQQKNKCYMPLQQKNKCYMPLKKQKNKTKKRKWRE